MASNVWFNYETTDEQDNPVNWNVECVVTVEQDPYGTGDSPASYDVEDIVVLTHSGRLTEGDLSDRQVEQIMRKAISTFKGE